MFGELIKFVDNDAVDKAKIGRAWDGSFITEEAEERVEKFAAEFWDETVFCIMVANTGDDFGAGFPFFDEIRNEFWGLLSVSVESNRGVAFSVFEPSRESRFFAEVAGERKDFSCGMFFGESLENF